MAHSQNEWLFIIFIISNLLPFESKNTIVLLSGLSACACNNSKIVVQIVIFRVNSS